MQPVRGAGRQDHVRSLLSSAARRLQPDSGAAAEHDDRLARELLLPGAAPAHVAFPVKTAVERSGGSGFSAPRTPSIATLALRLASVTRQPRTSSGASRRSSVGLAAVVLRAKARPNRC